MALKKVLMTYPNNANQYLPGTIAIPSALQIIAITQSSPMVITVSIDPVTEANTYQTGQLIKLLIPSSYKMIQANGLVGQIILVNGFQITVAIDSSSFDAFSIPAITAEQPASLSPAGSRNLQYNNTTNQVPFQSLNDFGN